MIKSLHLTNLLLAAFAFVTAMAIIYIPFVLEPSPSIVDDIQKFTKLSSPTYPPSKHSVTVENWTKWRLYVPKPTNDKPLVIYARTKDYVNLQEKKAVMNMEWRSEYQIIVEEKSDGSLTARIEAPAWSWKGWGICNHLNVSTSGRTVSILPRFLFGMQPETIEETYGREDVVDKIPIVGLFFASNNLDRIVFQMYMNVVILVVIFLLWANNPPETFLKKKQSI